MDGVSGVLAGVADETPTRRSLVEGKCHPLTVVVRPEQARAGDGWWKSSGDPGFGSMHLGALRIEGGTHRLDEEPPAICETEASGDPGREASWSVLSRSNRRTHPLHERVHHMGRKGSPGETSAFGERTGETFDRR